MAPIPAGVEMVEVGPLLADAGPTLARFRLTSTALGPISAEIGTELCKSGRFRAGLPRFRQNAAGPRSGTLIDQSRVQNEGGVGQIFLRRIPMISHVPFLPHTPGQPWGQLGCPTVHRADAAARKLRPELRSPNSECSMQMSLATSLPRLPWTRRPPVAAEAACSLSPTPCALPRTTRSELPPDGKTKVASDAQAIRPLINGERANSAQLKDRSNFLLEQTSDWQSTIFTEVMPSKGERERGHRR